MLVLDTGGYRPHADAQGSNKHEGVEVLPTLAHVLATDDLCLILPGIHLTQYQTGYVLALFADLDDGYLLHFNISMGLYSFSCILSGGSCCSPKAVQASSQS